MILNYTPERRRVKERCDFFRSAKSIPGGLPEQRPGGYGNLAGSFRDRLLDHPAILSPNQALEIDIAIGGHGLLHLLF